MYRNIDLLIGEAPELGSIRETLESAARALIECYEKGGRVFVCGNGGSAADSEHIVGELLKGFLKKRPLEKDTVEALNRIAGADFAGGLQNSLPAFSLVSQSSIMTAVINDLGQDVMFAQQLFGLCGGQDVCIGISTSGNSASVVNALAVAKYKGAVTVSLTGAPESRMSGLADIAVRVPADSTPRVQEYHIRVYHALCADVEEHFFNM